MCFVKKRTPSSNKQKKKCTGMTHILKNKSEKIDTEKLNLFILYCRLLHAFIKESGEIRN